MEILQALLEFFSGTGFCYFTWGNAIMILVSFVLFYLAIKKRFEPLLLVPIAFGMMLANIPLSSVMDAPTFHLLNEAANDAVPILNGDGSSFGFLNKEVGGLLYYLYQGDALGLFPPIIFMGVGAMTDFGPLIANPKSFLLGAAAQFGIYAAYFGAIAMGFNDKAAAAISIIGGADGPTSIFLAGKLGQTTLLGPIAVAAYSYMSLVPIIQPPIMRALTTEKERKIKMEQLRDVSKRERILFPIIV